MHEKNWQLSKSIMTFCLKCDLSDIGENFNILSYSNLHYLTVVNCWTTSQANLPKP